MYISKATRRITREAKTFYEQACLIYVWEMRKMDNAFGAGERSKKRDAARETKFDRFS
jgi:hypothetical protein